MTEETFEISTGKEIRDIYGFIALAMEYINQTVPDNIAEALMKQNILIQYEANKKVLTNKWNNG